jgi:peptidoglycan/LPS O-acetylase OafA/YrhL
MKAKQHFLWLDWLRFTAALVVIVFHVRQQTFVAYGALPLEQQTFWVAILYALTRFGNEAVIAFFVLSGFLVGGKGAERIAAGTFRAVDYSIDRVSRIMVPLVPAVGLTVIVNLLSQKAMSPWVVLGNVFALQGVIVPNLPSNGPLWSLAYEIWFYVLLLAVGIAAARKKFHMQSWLMILLICAVFTKLSATYLFCWIIGAVAYLRQPKQSTVKGLLFGIALTAYGVVGSQLTLDSTSVSPSSLRVLFPPKEVAHLLCGAGMALFIQQIVCYVPKSTSTRKFETMGTRLAAASYTLYLTHVPILIALEHYGLARADRLDFPSVRNALLALLACFLMGSVFFWLFEMRTAAVRKWIKQRLNHNSAIPNDADKDERAREVNVCVADCPAETPAAKI